MEDRSVSNEFLLLDALPVGILACVSSFLSAEDAIALGTSSHALRLTDLWTYKILALPSIYSKLDVAMGSFAAAARAYLSQVKAVVGQPAIHIGAAWIDNANYWNRNLAARESPFGHVHELKHVWWLDMSGTYELPIIDRATLARLPDGQPLELTCVLRVKLSGYVGRLKRSIDAVDVPEWMDVHYTLPGGMSGALPAPGVDIGPGTLHPGEPARRGVGQGIPEGAQGVDPGIDSQAAPRQVWLWLHLGTVTLRLRNEGAAGASAVAPSQGGDRRAKLRWRLWATDGSLKSGMKVDHMRVLAVHGPLRGISDPEGAVGVDQATPVLGVGYKGRDCTACSQEAGAQPYMPLDARQIWKLQLAGRIQEPPAAAAVPAAAAGQADRNVRPRVRAGRLHPRLQPAEGQQDAADAEGGEGNCCLM